MLDNGSEYTADEINAMFGCFARMHGVDDGNQRTVPEGHRQHVPQSGPPAPVGPPRPPAHARPAHPVAVQNQDQASLLSQIRIQPATSTAPAARPTTIQASPGGTSGDTPQPVVEREVKKLDQAEDDGQRAGYRELLTSVAEAQSVYRREIKAAAARASNDKRTASQQYGSNSGKLIPPSRFEIKWEKNLRQAKSDASKLVEVIQELGTTGDPEMTKLLKRYVSVRKKRVRFAIAKALRGVGTPEAFYQLLTLLRDRQDHVARAAVVSLTTDLNPTTLPPVLAYARLGSEERAVVATEIRKLESDSLKNDLLGFAQDSDGDMTAIALYIAGQVSDKNSVNDFTAFLDHTDPAVRLAAIDALLQTDNQQVARFLTEALSDAAPEVRARAATGLAKWPTKNSPRRVLKLMDDNSPLVRRSAAAALREIATEDLGAMVATYLTRERDPLALIAIIECVGRVAADRNSEALFALSRHTQEEVRIAALSALSRNGDRRITSSLGGLLEDDDPKVRVKVVTALGQPKNVRAIRQLAEVLKNDRETTVRAAAARALGQVGSKQVIPVLEQAMYDDASVRCQAVLALRRIGSESALPILIERLRDSAPEVRYNAVSALASLESRESIPEIVRLIEDSNDMVRRATHKALDKLGYGVSADLRKRRFRRLIQTLRGLVPNARVASAFASGIVTLVLVGVLILAPQAIGLGPKLFVGKARHIDVSPDGSKVSILRAGGISEVWNVSDGQLRVRKVTPFSALAGLFTPDSKQLRLLSDKRILTWDLSEDASPVETHTHDHMLQIRAISPDRNHMLTTTTTKITPEYWGRNGQPASVAVPAPFLREVAMSADGELIAGVNKRNELMVLRRSGEVLGKQQLSFPGERRPRVSSLAFSDKSLLAIGTRHGEHRFIDLAEGTEFSLTDGEPINRVHWIDNHLWSIEDGQIRVLHIVGSEKNADDPVTIDLPLSEPDMIAVSADHRVLAIGSRDSLDVAIVDTRARKLVQVLEIPVD